MFVRRCDFRRVAMPWRYARLGFVQDAFEMNQRMKRRPRPQRNLSQVL